MIWFSDSDGLLDCIDSAAFNGTAGCTCSNETVSPDSGCWIARPSSQTSERNSSHCRFVGWWDSDENDWSCPIEGCYETRMSSSKEAVSDFVLAWYGCGDGVCQSDRGETCATCSVDCGSSCSCTADVVVCEPADLHGITCSSLGFYGGELTCLPDCSDFNTTLCHNCGNHMVDEGEVCDGGNISDENCYSQGSAGNGLWCSDDCNYYDTSGCE